MTPATPTCGSFYGPYAGRLRPVPNLKRISLFVQKLLGSPKFRPTADPFPGGAGRPKCNQLEIVTTFTYKPSLVRIDARNFELSLYHTHTHTHTRTHTHTHTHTQTHPQTGPITIHCAAKLSVQCNKTSIQLIPCDAVRIALY